MKALLIKTSSIGDLIHTMPAVTDALASVSALTLDWVVEEGFAGVCRWHRGVRNVVPVAFRAWRRDLATLRLARLAREIGASHRALAAERYDVVIDAQGLYKSAVVTACARGRKYGFSRDSVRERPATLAYDATVQVPRDIGSVERNRRLLAGVFGYEVPSSEPDFAICTEHFRPPPPDRPYDLFIHAPSWRTKSWPLGHWRELAGRAAVEGFAIRIPWHSRAERRQAEAIAGGLDAAMSVEVDLEAMAGLASHAAGVVSVETGFAPLAAALGRPTVTLYGPTGTVRHATGGPARSRLVTTMACARCHAKRCVHVDVARQAAPCMAKLDAARAWQTLLAVRNLDNFRSVPPNPAVQSSISASPPNSR